MHYYQHHIGDFNNATRHLSLLERAVYRDLLDMYYEQESAIDGTNLTKLERRLCVRSTEEKEALTFVLDEFFDNQDGYYFNNRCEEEIKAYQDKVEIASKAGKASAEARRKKSAKKQRKTIKETEIVEHPLNVHDESVTTECERPFNDRSTNVQPTNNHKPLTTNQEPLTKENNKKNARENFDFESVKSWEPDFSEISKIVRAEYPDLPELTQSQYDSRLRKFKAHHIEKESLGEFIRTEERRIDLFVGWVGRSQDYVSSNDSDVDWENVGRKPINQTNPSANADAKPVKTPSIEPLPNMTMAETQMKLVTDKYPGETEYQTYTRLLKDFEVEA